MINSLKSGVAYLYPHAPPLKKKRKLKGFLMFSGGIGKQHQAVMG